MEADRPESVVYKRDTGWTVMLTAFDDDPDGYFAWLQSRRGWRLGHQQIHNPTMDRYCEARFDGFDAISTWDDMAGAVLFVRSLACPPEMILESLFGEYNPVRHKIIFD